MLDNFRLRVFASVADTGSFTVTARNLGVTQAAVSQHVAELEKTVGEELFARARGGVSLTAAGELLLKYVKNILWWYDRANAVCIQKSEAPDSPTLLELSNDKKAEISVIDGDLRIRFI